MVKIKEKSLEERAQEEQHNALFQFTAGLVGEENIRETKELLYFSIYGGDVHVSSLSNMVNVYNPERFDEALRLAKEYEKMTGEEFTLKKEYFNHNKSK